MTDCRRAFRGISQEISMYIGEKSLGIVFIIALIIFLLRKI